MQDKIPDRNYQMYELALFAVKRLYADTSVTSETCRRNLEALRDEIDAMLAALPDHADLAGADEG